MGEFVQVGINILIFVLIGGYAIVAVRYQRKRKKEGIGCCGSCQNCSGCNADKL